MDAEYFCGRKRLTRKDYQQRKLKFDTKGKRPVCRTLCSIAMHLSRAKMFFFLWGSHTHHNFEENTLHFIFIDALLITTWRGRL